jgi:hypothetical protein
VPSTPQKARHSSSRHDQELQPPVGRAEDAARHGAPNPLAFEVNHHHANDLHGAGRLQQAHLDAPAARLVAPGVEGSGERLEGVE